MDAETLQGMGERHYHLQSLRVTFRPGIDGFRALSVLNSFSGQGLVRFDQPTLVLAILSSQNWGKGLENTRTLEMKFPAGVLWEMPDFKGIAQKGIENIQISSSSPLNALRSSRQKKVEEAYADIVKQVLPETLRREIKDFGLELHTFLMEDRNFPTIAIVVENNGRPDLSLFLDGWSGIIRNKEGQAICFCGDLKTAEDEVRKAFNEYFERATA